MKNKTKNKLYKSKGKLTKVKHIKKIIEDLEEV